MPEFIKVVSVPNSPATIFVNLTFQPIPESLKKKTNPDIFGF